MPTCRYHYDPLDRLAARTDSAQDSTRHFYQASRLATAIGNDLQRTILATDGQLLAQKDVSTAGERSHLLATDQQDSVLRAVSAGQRVDIAYSPHGHHQDPGPLPGFNGQDSDLLTGHYLLGNGYRAYNPVLRRFNSPDSLSPFGEGGLNAYAYCHGDPVNRVDPSGHLDLDVDFLTVAFGYSWSLLAFGRATYGFKLAMPKVRKGLKRSTPNLTPDSPPGLIAQAKGQATLDRTAAVVAVAQLVSGTLAFAGATARLAGADQLVSIALMGGALLTGVPAFATQIVTRRFEQRFMPRLLDRFGNRSPVRGSMVARGDQFKNAIARAGAIPAVSVSQSIRHRSYETFLMQQTLSQAKRIRRNTR